VTATSDEDRLSYSINFVEFHLIGLVCHIIRHTFTLVVEASWRFLKLLDGGGQSKTQDGRSNEEPRGFSLLERD